jgi:hypothetical protein
MAVFPPHYRLTGVCTNIVATIILTISDGYGYVNILVNENDSATGWG